MNHLNKWSKTTAALLALGIVSSSVSTVTYASGDEAVKTEQAEKSKTAVKDQTAQMLGQQNIMSVAWYQNSAEAKALYAQGYNTAKETLSKKIKNHHGGKKLAIVLDIDETVLDNSPYQAMSALKVKLFQKVGMNGFNLHKLNLFMGLSRFYNMQTATMLKFLCFRPFA